MVAMLAAYAGVALAERPTDMLSWWPGEGSAEDVKGTNDGTLQNGTTFAAGKVGQAFSFDGVDDYVSFGSSAGNFGTGDFTVDFWIKTNATRIEGVMGKRPVCTHDNFWDSRIGGGYINIELDQDNAGTGHMSVVATQPVNDGNFHHVAFVRQGQAVSIYIDGVLDVSEEASIDHNLSNFADLNVGKSSCTGFDGTNFFSGQLDEIALYDRALSDEEIWAIFDATAPRVTGTAPANKATGIARNTNLTATFSEKMDRSTLLSDPTKQTSTSSTVKLFKVNPDGTTKRVSATVSCEALAPDPCQEIVLNPFGTSSTRLAASTKYKALVTTGAKDLAGNALDQNSTKDGNQKKVWTFTTGDS